MFRPEDLTIESMPPHQKGGQHCGAVPRGIRITHRPTGIVVDSLHERSQHLNREKALALLEERLAAL